MTVVLRLNGERCEASAEDAPRLIDLLRDRLGLTAAKIACETGRCGACMTLIDGRPVNACLTPTWRLDGADVVTPEGLDAIPEARIVRAALAEENAFQCGYCAPGFVISLTALFVASPEAGEDAIRAALAGNICRCTGYHSIMRAALNAGPRLAEARR